MRRLSTIRYIIIILLITGALFFVLNKKNSSVFSRTTGSPSEQKATPKAPAKPKIPDGPYVAVSGISIPVEVVQTSEAVRKGLSGRASLASDSGMLFIFSKPDIYQFWMPDMHFPIDIIWINDGKVVDIDAEVSNAFDAAHPAFYRPKVPVQYVLEVNAGFAARQYITVGSTITFNHLE